MIPPSEEAAGAISAMRQDGRSAPLALLVKRLDQQRFTLSASHVVGGRQDRNGQVPVAQNKIAALCFEEFIEKLTRTVHFGAHGKGGGWSHRRRPQGLGELVVQGVVRIVDDDSRLRVGVTVQ